MLASVAAAAAFAASVTSAHAAEITVQGEAATEANIPTASDPDASHGAYLELQTGDNAPAGGWFATYEVDVPIAGVYRLDAVATSPAGHSYFNLSVNGGEFVQVSKSLTSWLDFPSAWGELSSIEVDDVELQAGTNSITFMVDERRLAPAPANYSFALDEFKLTSTALALEAVRVGDPSRTIGTYRGGRRGVLRFTLNGHAADDQRVRYRVVDYFGEAVASGVATVEAGKAATRATLPELPPGSYRVVARLASTPQARVVGYFARLPERRPVTGPANRFAVMGLSAGTPSARLDAFAAGMRDMGASWVRDLLPWDLVEPERGSYDTSVYDRYVRAFAEHGIETLMLWDSTPEWARTETSDLLPGDLRDAYNFAGHLARQAGGVGSGALELWNEPEHELDRCCTGDRMAAYTKAAGLGIDDAPAGPPTALPAIFDEGPFQDLMLQNDVVRYADIWAFHSYPPQFPNPGALTPFAPQSEIQNELQRLYDPTGRTDAWSTEAGIFALGPFGGGLSPSDQVDQARYLVQSTVQDLAAGTDKHFWFIGIPCCGGELEPGRSLVFGLLSRDFQPWPAYSAHAAMASILGEANFSRAIPGLPGNAFGYVFNDGGRSVTVLWADADTEIEVPVRGRAIGLYDVMGRRRPAPAVRNGRLRVTASLDPIYVVSDRPARVEEEPASDVSAPLSKAEHIVLGQQFAAANAAPPKDAGQPPPYGYELDATTEMSVDVYNFNPTPKTVAVSGHAYGGWSVESVGAASVRVPAGGRMSVPFRLSSSAQTASGVDLPLVFEARVDGQDVPPSVSRVQLRAAGPPGEQVALAPQITDVSPADGATVTAPEVELTARIRDAVSGVDPDRVEVHVDGQHVDHSYDASTGRLSAELRLAYGPHEIAIRTSNNAHAPAAVRLMVRRASAPALRSRRVRRDAAVIPLRDGSGERRRPPFQIEGSPLAGGP